MDRIDQVDSLTVIVAHTDDESLFCGGLLLKLKCPLRVVLATRIADCNTISDDPEKEEQRILARSVAFRSVCRGLGAQITWLNYAKGVIRDDYLRQAVRNSHTVLTHGPCGEYGHSDHVQVHWAVLEARKGPIWCFAKEGQRVHIDWGKKKKLLQHYEYGCTRTPHWRPWENPNYAAWCGDNEHYQLVE